jgi:hypothetical protein
MTQKEQNAFEFTKALLTSISNLVVYADEKQAVQHFQGFINSGFLLAELFEQKREENRNKLTNKIK